MVPLFDPFVYPQGKARHRHAVGAPSGAQKPSVMPQLPDWRANLPVSYAAEAAPTAAPTATPTGSPLRVPPPSVSGILAAMGRGLEASLTENTPAAESPGPDLDCGQVPHL